jgi:hypothetical protein
MALHQQLIQLFVNEWLWHLEVQQFVHTFLHLLLAVRHPQKPILEVVSIHLQVESRVRKETNAIMVSNQDSLVQFVPYPFLQPGDHFKWHLVRKLVYSLSY